MRIVGLDFETFYASKQGYGIKELGTYAYLQDPRFDPYLISCADADEVWAGEPKYFNWHSIDETYDPDPLIIVSHNKKFDFSVYRRMVELGLAPEIRYTSWLCTADMSSFLCNRRALDDACKFLLRVELSKDVRDRANGKTVAQMKAEGWWKDMIAYGKRDSRYCRQLFVEHGHRWPQFERRLSEQTVAQCRRGIQVDVPKLQEYVKVAHNMMKDTEATLPWIAEGRPPTSPKAIAEHCRLHKIPSPPVKTREGEDAFIEWENTYGPKHPWIANVSNWRSINKFLDSLQTIQGRLDPSGIFSFGLKYFGAHTGRWSGDAGINMQNLRKEPLYRDDRGFLITDAAQLKQINDELMAAEKQKRPVKLPSFVTASLDIRSIFTARPGKKMIIADLSQIEPRVLAWVTGNKKMLDLMAAGMSPYEAHARTALKWTGGKLKDENKELYALAKAQVLGLGYQCAWEKFIAVAWAMAGYDVTRDDPEWVPVLNDEGQPVLNKDGTPKVESGYGYTSKRIVKSFREENPLTTGLWARLDTAFKSSVLEGEFRMELPSGREMVYRKVAREWVSHYDEEEKRYKRKCCVTAEAVKNGRLTRVPLYGGLLTENLVQAIARDVFGECILSIDDTFGAGTVLFSEHDGAINEVDQDVTAKDIARVMTQTPAWIPGLPLDVESKEVPHYLK